jgi:hypothetical protein
MGAYVNLEPCVGVYNFLATPIMVNFNVMGGILVLKTSLRFYSSFDISIMINFCSMSNYGPFWCSGWYFDFEPSLGIYNSLGIPIMTHFVCMGGCLYLKPTLGVCNFVGISIMTHFNCMGGYLYLKLTLGVSKSYG